MPIYVLLTTWTDAGVSSYADLAASDDLPLQRRQRIEQGLAAVNGELIGTYWTLGTYDMVLIVNAASNEEIGGFALALSQEGARTVTMPAFDAEAAKNVLATAKLCGAGLANPAAAGPQ
jgi:uncharacterized protein with GYD domain